MGARAGGALVPRPEHPGGSRASARDLALGPRAPDVAPAGQEARRLHQRGGTAFALVAGRAVADTYLDDGDLVVGGDEALAIVVLEHLRAFVE